MTLEQIVFLVLAVAAIGTAVGVVISRNILCSAFLLIGCLFMIAGFYVLLEAPFLAAVQVLIYVGAIAVLIIFAVMLTENLMQRKRAWNEQWWVAILVAVALAAVLLYVVVTAQWQVSQLETPSDVITALGQALMSTYVLPFEVASVLLLMALIGAIVVAREEKEEGK